LRRPSHLEVIGSEQRLYGGGQGDNLRGGDQVDFCSGAGGRDECDGGPPSKGGRGPRGRPSGGGARRDPDICAKDVEEPSDCDRAGGGDDIDIGEENPI
jgi:hypothetical protein